MKITIEMTEKETAEFVSQLQTRQKQSNDIIRTTYKTILSKFCDDFDLHDEETNMALENLAKE